MQRCRLGPDADATGVWMSGVIHTGYSFLRGSSRRAARLLKRRNGHRLTRFRSWGHGVHDPAKSRAYVVPRGLRLNVHAPLHADLQLLAQPRRALVRRADHEMDQTRKPPLRPRPRRLDPHLDHQLERQPQTVRLAQNRRRDPRQPRRLLPTDQRLRTLVRRRLDFVARPLLPALRRPDRCVREDDPLVGQRGPYALRRALRGARPPGLVILREPDETRVVPRSRARSSSCCRATDSTSRSRARSASPTWSAARASSPSAAARSR